MQSAVVQNEGEIQLLNEESESKLKEHAHAIQEINNRAQDLHRANEENLRMNAVSEQKIKIYSLKMDKMKKIIQNGIDLLRKCPRDEEFTLRLDKHSFCKRALAVSHGYTN